jgi:hypothetical protein
MIKLDRNLVANTDKGMVTFKAGDVVGKDDIKAVVYDMLVDRGYGEVVEDKSPVKKTKRKVKKATKKKVEPKAEPKSEEAKSE